MLPKSTFLARQAPDTHPGPLDIDQPGLPPLGVTVIAGSVNIIRTAAELYPARLIVHRVLIEDHVAR